MVKIMSDDQRYDIGWAMRTLAKGRSVRRAGWESWSIFYASTLKAIYVYTETDLSPWVPTHEDLFAQDWRHASFTPDARESVSSAETPEFRPEEDAEVDDSQQLPSQGGERYDRPSPL